MSAPTSQLRLSLPVRAARTVRAGRASRIGRAVGLPLAAAGAGGAAGAWAAAARAAGADRPFAVYAGALTGLLLGTAVTLALSRRRLVRELRDRTEALHALTARTAAADAARADDARRAAACLGAVRRSLRDAEVRRHTAAEAALSLRAALRAQTARAAALEGDAVRLADLTLPLAAAELRAGSSPDAVLAGLPRPAGAAHQRLLGVLVGELAAGERVRAAGLAACGDAAGRVRALTSAVLTDLRDLERRPGTVALADLFGLGHRTAQAGRLADSIAVLTGTGRGAPRGPADPVPVRAVLRDATDRIDGYARVQVRTTTVGPDGADRAGGTIAVAGHAAGDVTHLLAELLDNAARFSPPDLDVRVQARVTPSGLVVSIDDAGPGMAGACLARAAVLVSGDASFAADPADVPGIGLAVVGRLAREHGLQVTFRPSSWGGTGVVVLVPPALLVRFPAAPIPLPPAAGPAPGPPAPSPLPKRPRGRTLEAARYGDLTDNRASGWLDGPDAP